MANTKSAEKRARQSEKRRVRNRVVRSRTRTYVKRANAEIVTGDKDTAEAAVREALRQLDKAAQAGVIHPNNAARRKSRLMHKLNAL